MAGHDSTPYGVIYRITNRANGKVYVGQTTAPVAERWAAHCRADSYCWALRAAIKKYGKEGFAVEVIATASSKEELDEKEIRFITLYRSNRPENGYNLRGGGSFGKHSEESKIRMSIAVRKAYENPAFKQKLSAVRTGKKRSAEFRQKASLRMIGNSMTSAARGRLSASVRGLWESPEYREKVSDGQRVARSDEAYLKTVSENTKAQWSDPDKKAELIAAQTAGKLAMWADPARKAAILEKRAATRAAKQQASN